MQIKNIYDHEVILNGTQGLFNCKTESLSIQYPNEIQAQFKRCLISTMKKIMMSKQQWYSSKDFELN